LFFLQITSVIHEDCLDVCYEGFVFRLQIVATPEVEAVQLAAGAPSVLLRVCVQVVAHQKHDCCSHDVTVGKSGADGDEALQRAVVRSVVVPPLHHLSVRSLRAQFPSYTAAVRLMAMWAAQHYFSGEFQYLTVLSPTVI
jgi:hypothetical protein